MKQALQGGNLSCAKRLPLWPPFSAHPPYVTAAETPRVTSDFQGRLLRSGHGRKALRDSQREERKRDHAVQHGSKAVMISHRSEDRHSQST